MVPVGLIGVLAAGACSSARSAPSEEPAPPEAAATTTTTGPASIEQGLEITTGSGVVAGIDSGATRAFLGVPYAAPPTGENRWRPPQPPDSWEGIRVATEPGEVCLQADLAATEILGDEDCLTLNIWTPSPAPAAPRPVMVWFHGGAFIFGTGSSPAYDGRLFVEATDVVMVTVNYRLGPLGFLAHPAVTAEGGSSNFGLEDQQAALRWVRENIAAFGGDPDSVTVFGESAGGMSGCLLLVSPAGQGLVDRMITQSHPCTAPPPVRPLAEAEALGEEYAGRLECADPGSAMDCLRSRTPVELMQAIGQNGRPGGLFYQGSGSWWLPITADGTVVPDDLDTLFANGDFAPVPVLMGTNTDEGTLFHSGIVGDTPVADEDELREALQRAFGPDVEDILAQYPAGDYDDVNDRFAAITTDAFYTCPAVRSAELLSEGGSDVYLYEFARPLEGISELLGLGATHAAEIAFLFGTDDAIGLGTIGADDWPLSEQMMRYWARFAETGDPNGDGAVNWPAFTVENPQLLRLDTPITVESSAGRDRCALWDP